MKREGALPELLAPAGDFECLVAAVKAGADAVYLGAKDFNARASAGNFDDEELRRAVEYCHLFGVRLFVTLNTLVENKELSSALSLAARLYEIGVDALIIADIGLMSILRRELPELELHASTQMSVHNTYGADAAHSLGCSRVVLARELSAKNISAVIERCKPEVEVFVHGALCVCHSGQCLFSSMVGGRSGNRGECAQPCRLPDANGGYPLSLKDLSLAKHIRELVESGVSSLKIEGRMKSPDYVYTVTSIYRRLLDECRNAGDGEMRTLERVFSRGGFTDGYFVGRLERGMTGVRSSEDKRASRDSAVGKIIPDRLPVSAEVKILRGKPSELTLCLMSGALAGHRVTVTGDVPAEAKTAPLTEESVTLRLCKMGETPLSLSPSDLSLELDEGLNMSPGMLNSLRRKAVEALLYRGRTLPGEISLPKVKEKELDTPRGRTALFLSSAIYDKLCGGGDNKFFSVCYLPLASINEVENIPNGVYIPPVIMEDEIYEVRELLTLAKERGVKYALVGNLGALELVRSAGLVPVGDFRLNVMNGATRVALSELISEDIIISPELTIPSARGVGGREIVYGRIPLMLTERCFMREIHGCESCSRGFLQDRKGIKFPIFREWKHRNLILNSSPTFMGDRQEQLDSAALAQHFIFTTESVGEIRKIIRAFENGEAYPFNTPFRRIGKREAK